MIEMLRIKTNINSKLELSEETVILDSGKLSVAGRGGTIFSIDTKEIEKAFIEEGLGIAKLVIKRKSGNESEIAYFTKSKVKQFRKFADAINQYIATNKMVDTSFEEERKKSSSIGTLAWLYGFASKHNKLLIVGVLLSLVVVGLNLVPPYLLKILIDNVILAQTRSEMLFEFLTVVLVASYIASAAMGAIQSYALNIAGNRIVTELKSRLFKYSVKLSATDIDTISPTLIQTRLTSDVANTQWLMTYGLSTTVTNILTIIGIGVILFILFPTLALYVLIPIPFILLFIWSYNNHSNKMYHKSWRRGADLTTKINDTIPNYTIVKSATKENYEGKEFDDQLKKYYDTQVGIIKMELSYWQPIGLMVSLVAVIIWWVGGNLVILGTIQLGIVTAFLAYMGMFYGPIQQLSTLMPNIQEALTSGERLREIFDTDETDKEPRGTQKAALDKDISFNKVWFGYDPLFPVIKGINMKISKGKVTAIVGKSGAGKSTISKLLLGLYKIDSGDIKFGSVSINDIDVNYLREHISYVPQDSTFFDNTVAYNISYYSKNPVDPQKLIATSKAVEMHSEIMRLPLCYDNRIRGRGTSLSGGQRQRLAVARAIIGNPDIVVFDEITSNLDAINARRVNRAVLKVEGDKTRIFVTHDMNEILNSDFVIVLDKGEIAEQGRPSELVRKKGKLYQMFKYKLGNRSVGKLHPNKGTLDSFIKDFVIDEKSIKIEPGERASFVNVTRNNKVLKRLIPKKPFPISYPGFIIFYGKNEKEAFALKGYEKLDQKSKELLEHTLEVNNFNPKVLSIKEIKITGDGLEWILQTNKGDMKYKTKNRSDIVFRNNFLILIDEFNTPLKIDVNSLDKKSLDVIDRSV